MCAATSVHIKIQLITHYTLGVFPFNKPPHSIHSMQLFVLYVSLESPVQIYSFLMKRKWSWLAIWWFFSDEGRHSFIFGYFCKCFWSIHYSGTLFDVSTFFSASLRHRYSWFKKRNEKERCAKKKKETLNEFRGRKYLWYIENTE